VDRLILSFGSRLESRWADITKAAMSALAIVKALDVIEHVGSRFISRQVARTVNSLAFDGSRYT
jgi:hypothetical protein